MNNDIIRFKKCLVQEGKRGLALDIDETLSWTTAYWFERMQLYFGNPEGLEVHTMIKKYRYTERVPYWQTTEALQWMENHREDDYFQEEFILIENASHLVNKVHKIIPVVLYLTNRPESVKRGTKAWLKKHGFPEAEVILRPKDIRITEGIRWKAQILEYLYPEIVGIVDDNPGLVDAVSSDYKGSIYLYNHTKYPRSGINVVACKNWSSVYEAIINKYRK